MTDLEYIELAFHRAKSKIKPIAMDSSEVDETAILVYRIFEMIIEELREINESLGEFKSD